MIATLEIIPEGDAFVYRDAFAALAELGWFTKAYPPDIYIFEKSVSSPLEAQEGVLKAFGITSLGELGENIAQLEVTKGGTTWTM